MTKKLRVVRHVDGRLVMRPSKNHPNPQHWDALRMAVRLAQNNECGVCWRNGNDYTLELHHRHYETFGDETVSDVIMLCTSCHEAITSVIRNRRRALGDQTLEVLECEAKEELVRPKTRQAVMPKIQPEKLEIRSSRPAIRGNAIKGE